MLRCLMMLALISTTSCASEDRAGLCVLEDGVWVGAVEAEVCELLGLRPVHNAMKPRDLLELIVGDDCSYLENGVL